MARLLSSSFARSLLLIVGGTIGAGMFGLPVLFAQSGRLWGSILYWAIVAVVLIIHIAYAELQAKAGSKHDVAGIVKRSLGWWGWLVAIIVSPVSAYGSMLLYVLLGSQFISALSGAIGGPTSLFGWQMTLWVFFAWGTHKGVKGVERFERPLTFFLIAGLVAVSLIAALYNGTAPQSAPSLESFSFATFVAVVFFASISLPLVSEAMEFAGHKSKIGRRAILVGFLGVAALKWLFGLSFASTATGGVVEVLGLMTALPPALGWLLPLTGLLAMSVAGVTVLDTLQITYRDEFSFSPLYAWLMAVLPLLVLLWTSTQSILPLMAFLGSFVVSTNALLVCAAAIVERARLVGRYPRALLCGAICLCLFTLAHTFIL